MNDHDSVNVLAVYGSLAPGESNHWVVSRISGEWVGGSVRGYVFDLTWGPADGYLGFVPDADGVDVRLAILISPDLSKKWREIDEFEGPGYERRVLPVLLDDGREIDAHIYVALTDS